jgi:quinol monooxygenase YgiN
MDLDCFFSSEKLNARFAEYKKVPLYATMNTGSLPDKVAHHLDHSYSNASHLLDEWQGRLGYFWVGASTGSLHYDDHDNLLCQICGRKKVILIPFEHTFAFRMGSLWDVFPNHSGFNASFFTEETRAAHPGLQEVPYFEADLGPGDTLLIPAGMLHAPIGDLDSISANIFVFDGPPPCPRSWWLLKRLEISTRVRKLLKLPLAHHDYQVRKAHDIEATSASRHWKAAKTAISLRRSLSRRMGKEEQRGSGVEGSSADQRFMCTVEVNVDPSNREKFLGLMRELCEPSKRELGCLRYEFVQVQDEPNRFLLMEEWRSMTDLERHKHTEHYTSIAPRIFELAKCSVTKLKPMGF